MSIHGPPVVSNDGAMRLKLENNGNDDGGTGKTVSGQGYSNFDVNGTASGARNKMGTSPVLGAASTT